MFAYAIPRRRNTRSLGFSFFSYVPISTAHPGLSLFGCCYRLAVVTSVDTRRPKSARLPHGNRILDTRNCPINARYLCDRGLVCREIELSPISLARSRRERRKLVNGDAHTRYDTALLLYLLNLYNRHIADSISSLLLS